MFFTLCPTLTCVCVYLILHVFAYICISLHTFLVKVKLIWLPSSWSEPSFVSATSDACLVLQLHHQNSSSAWQNWKSYCSVNSTGISSFNTRILTTIYMQRISKFLSSVLASPRKPYVFMAALYVCVSIGFSAQNSRFPSPTTKWILLQVVFPENGIQIFQTKIWMLQIPWFSSSPKFNLLLKPELIYLSTF